MKIALFGGTFNPIHLGHLLVAQNAIKSPEMDRIFFVPCSLPPHKVDDELLPGHHRQAMIRLAIRDQPKFKVLTVEIERGGTSYSVDTLLQVRRQHPDDRIFFIVGSDNFQDIGGWHRFSELVHLCEFLVIERPGCCLKLPPSTVPVEKIPFLRYTVLQGPTLSVSSSGIRQQLREGGDVSRLIPLPVHDYIRQHSLYQHSA